MDKLNGDGILSFFGFNNEDQKSGAHDAIMAALELRENFENIKEKMDRNMVKGFWSQKDLARC